MTSIFNSALASSLTYNEYREWIRKQLALGLSTGDEQSEALTHYSELNEARMRRLDKTLHILPEVSAALLPYKAKWIGLALAEGWCGDAAQIVPIWHKMAEETQAFSLHIVLRDRHDELMQLFLTNGTKSIPKLIVLDAQTHELVAHYGPRPVGAQQLMTNYKALHGQIDDNAKTKLQKWYLNDKGYSVQLELTELLTKTS
ncbi:MAG: thioredoxin family protein [Flavobacterium sp. BFFFF2]|nr:MAG: thioredoxin family protein [Flavobacterium sp. BFFFF2]